jgi:acetylornithine deacetylase/succinyl-diaminopimelate desuccinylase-like protein
MVHGTVGLEGNPAMLVSSARVKMRRQSRLRKGDGMARRILSIFVLLAGIILLVTFRPAALNSQTPAPGATPDLLQLTAEAQTWLTDLIRINTTNPPGNELEAAKYIQNILQKENIPADILEMKPGRGIVVARLQVGPLPDSSKALLLVGHLDVVGVDRAKWSVDPFAATQKDDYIYGRGAIDDKGMVAANLAAFIGLKRSSARLTRDVIFLADDDEEQGGDASIRAVIDRYWDKIACGFAINEGGGVVLQNGKVQYVAIQTSEKVAYNVMVTATGTSGHASVPQKDNPVVHLAAAVQKVGTLETPLHLLTITRRFFEQLAPVEDEDIAKWIRALDTSDRADLAALRLAAMNPVWNSMLRDTIAPTELSAGVRANVVPAQASANLNIRLLPGNSILDVIEQMQKSVNDPQVKFTVQPDAGPSAPSSSITSEFYQTVERLAPRQFPGAVVVPYLSTWATDSAYLRLHNVQSYGLVPFPLTEADMLRMHGDDERIPIASFRMGVDFLYKAVHEFVTK